MSLPAHFWRRTLAVSTASLLGATLAAALPGTPGAAAAPTGSAPAHLEVGGLTDPLGIDDTTPTLSWQDPASVAVQSAFQVRVASSVDALPSADLWDTGKVASPSLATTYAGRSLDSRDHAVWQVRVWDEHGAASGWSDPATFEIGLLSSADWEAEWITNPEWVEPLHQDLEFAAQTARYVRVTVTDLGRPEEPLDDMAWKPRLELGEIALRNGDDSANLMTGARVTVSERRTVRGVWEPNFMVDGKLTTADAPRGYRSNYHQETDVQDDPIVMTFQLPEDRTFDTVELYSLWDSPGRYGATPNYPRDVQVETSTDGTTWTSQASKSKLPAVSTLHEAPEALPVFATDFEADDIASARLFVTGLGVYNASINGEPVSEDLLEPANTQHSKRVPYAAYDVTDLLEDGENSLGVEVGNGIFNVFNTPDAASRYVKTQSGHGAPRVMGQLEITHTDGTVTTVATDAGEDSEWRTTLGEVTFTNWYGGEDVDARRHIDGWDEAGTDRSAWTTPVASSAPRQTTQLVGRTQPPIRQVDELETTWTQLPNGDYLFDFGVNFAGWQQLAVTGPAGTAITMRPGERLKRDGEGVTTGVDQASSGNNSWDTFTLAGTGEAETFTPRFRYHGMRWLQVSGLPSAPTADTMKGLVLRTDNADVGEFESSSDMLNDIHTIIDRSVQSNMYSVLTDCPHREKLGWLDQTNLNFNTVARGYDMQAQYRKLIQDAADAQQANGLIPTTAPEDSLFAGAFRHDANWGATMSVSAWQVYEEYGDAEPMRKFWPNMVRYEEFLTSQASNFILPGGLNDWATPEETANKVPDAFVQTYAWHKIARAMTDIATTLGKPAQARTYAQKAQRIEAAFNATYDADANGVYSVGSQAAQALALDEDLVPAELRPAAVEALLARIQANGEQFMVGEVGLYALLRVLAEEGQHDLVHRLATRATGNSYAKFIGQGATSLPEHWSGMGGTGSQNHYMMGMLEGWLHGSLAGLQQAPGSVAWEHVLVQPALVEGIDSAGTSYDSVRGTIATSWSRTDGVLSLSVTVPGNTVATVRVPNAEDGSAAYGPRGAKVVPSDVAGYTQFEVGTGSWEFGAGGEAPAWSTQVAVTASPRSYGAGGTVDVAVDDADGTPVDAGSVTVTGLGAQQVLPLVDGVARAAVPAGLAPGTHPINVAYTGSGRFTDAAGAGNVQITKATAVVTTKVVRKPQRRKGVLKVALAPSTGIVAGVARPTGKVKVVLKKGGRKVVVDARLRKGVARVALPRLSRGSWKIAVRHPGDANYLRLPLTSVGRVVIKR